MSFSIGSRENQLMLESFETDDPIRQAYYDRNKEFLGCAKPLESCLTEDPLQVMLSGKVAAHARSRGNPSRSGVLG